MGILVPQPGIESLPPALAGRFLITGPPGNSQTPFIFMGYLIHKSEHGMEGDPKIENESPCFHPRLALPHVFFMHLLCPLQRKTRGQ